MPVVSVNLTDNAWTIYKMWRDHGRSASYKVSLAIERMFEATEQVPRIQLGDKRTSITGDELEWTENGWKVIE
jgi:hypothetical protein